MQKEDVNERGEWISKEVAYRRAKEMTEEMIENWNATVKPEDLVWHLGDFSFCDPEPILKRLNGKIKFIAGNHDKPMLEYLRHNYPANVELIGGPPVTVDGDRVYALVRTNVKGQEVVLCHFSQLVWDKSHYKAICLHGHSHSTLQYPSENMRTMDVGVDAVAKMYATVVKPDPKVQAILDEKRTLAVKDYRTDGEIERMKFLNALLTDLAPYLTRVEVNRKDYRPIHHDEVMAVMSQKTFVAIDHHEERE